MTKFRMMRLAGFDPLAAALLAALSALVGQPSGVVRVLNVEYTVVRTTEAA